MQSVTGGMSLEIVPAEYFYVRSVVLVYIHHNHPYREYTPP